MPLTVSIPSLNYLANAASYTLVDDDDDDDDDDDVVDDDDEEEEEEEEEAAAIGSIVNKPLVSFF